MSAKSTKLTQWIQELMESETDGGIPYKAVIALVKEKKLTAKDLDAIHKELHDRHIPLILTIRKKTNMMLRISSMKI